MLGCSGGDLMGQKVGQGDDITPLLGLQQPFPSLLILAVKPLCYLKRPLYSSACHMQRPQLSYQMSMFLQISARP